MRVEEVVEAVEAVVKKLGVEATEELVQLEAVEELVQLKPGQPDCWILETVPAL